MPMTKAEMEEHDRQYHALMAQAQTALRQGLFRQAVQSALAAWDHIDGMMQYDRKYENAAFNTIPAVDLVLRYAPLLLDFRPLDRLEVLLKEYRRIERDTKADLADQLAQARARLWNAHRLWDYIEHHADVRQAELRGALGGQQQEWADIVTAWEKMGLLRRIPDGSTYTLAFSTRMGELASAKCPECGASRSAPKVSVPERDGMPSVQETVAACAAPGRTVGGMIHVAGDHFRNGHRNWRRLHVRLGARRAPTSPQ